MHNDYTGTDFELDDVVIWTAVDDPQTGVPSGKHFLGKVVGVNDGEIEVEPFNELPGSTWMDGHTQPSILLSFPTRCESAGRNARFLPTRRRTHLHRRFFALRAKALTTKTRTAR